jgi:hypothetical protein
MYSYINHNTSDNGELQLNNYIQDIREEHSEQTDDENDEDEDDFAKLISLLLSHRTNMDRTPYRGPSFL